MNKIAKFIVKHRTLIAIIMAVLVLISSVILFFVKINSDIISYLPNNKPTKQGLDHLVKNFDLKGDITIGIRDLDKKYVKDVVDKISKLPNVKKENGVMWIGTIEDQTSSLKSIMPGIIDEKLIAELLTPKLKDGKDDPVFIILVFLSVPSASNEATKTINTISEILGSQKNNAGSMYEYRFGGSAAITRDIFNSVFSEVWKFAIIGVLVIVIILLLTTQSLIEPIILLLTLAASILLNMGSNIIFGEVSSVTMSISAILQLGLSMDYAIFLIHAYYREKIDGYDDETAMQRAIPKTFSTVFASALTTVFGFIALFFMQFQMGADLGRVLAKGVFLSMLTVLLLQPSLILIFKRPLAKYSHKVLAPSFEKTSSYLTRHKYIVLLVCILVLIPSIMLQTKISYSYMDMGTQSKSPTALEEKVNSMGNTIVVAVPVKNENNKLSEEGLEQQKKFVKDIKGIELNGNKVVDNIMGLFSLIPDNNIVIDGFIQKNLFKFDGFKQFVNNDYAIYSIMLDSKINPESEECMQIIEQINKYIKSNFGEKSKYYVTGTAQSVKDLKEITPKDFLIVTLVSMLSIFIILVFTIKSLKVSTLLIALIEFGIFLNIAISIMFKIQLNFMAYIVISAVQLGATVDYAILYTINFRRNKSKMSIKEASYQASKDTGASILTSASIIVGSCLSVSVFSSNLIIKQLTMLIGRGAIISSILVLFVLPALLCIFDKNVKTKKVRKYLKKNKTRLDKYGAYVYDLSDNEKNHKKNKKQKQPKAQFS